MIEEEQLSEADILHFKEQNHRRVKRVVTLVAITLMLTAFVLVVLSLSLGSKIDDLGTAPRKSLHASASLRNAAMCVPGTETSALSPRWEA